MTTAHLLRRECPFPKWHCRALYLQSLGECVQAAAPHTRSLAAGSALCPMAICPAQCRSPPQHPAGARGRHIKARAFQLNSCWWKYEACAHLRLPSVRVAKRTGIWQILATMVTSRTPRAQSWAKPDTCKERLPGSEPNYRVCLTSVSLSLQQLFRDNTPWWTRCFWHHLLATASGIGSCQHDSF